MTAADRLQIFLQKHKDRVWVFLSTFLCGFFVHFYMFSNKLINYFEMNNILTPMSIEKGDTLAMGRWFLPLVSRLSSVYSMPAVNGMICLICLSLTACMIVDVFGFKRRVLIVLCEGVIVSFPGVASYLSYGVNTDVFCVALLLSVAAGWVLHQSACSIRGMAGSAVLLCFSIGVYQPFMSVTIAIIFCMLYLAVWQEGKGFFTILKQVIRYVLTLAVGFILYYLILQIVTAVTGISMGDYHGINDMTSFTLKGIAKGGVYTYFYFLYYLFSMEYANFPVVIAFDGLAALLFFYYTIAGYRAHRKGMREKGSPVCQILLVIFLPIGVNAAPFLMADRVGNGVDRYMTVSMMLLFVLLVKLMDVMSEKESGGTEEAQLTERDGKSTVKARAERVPQWLVIACLIAVIWGNYYMCNQGYYRAEAMTKSTDSLLTRLAYRIESVEGWNPDMPVYLANCRALFNENCDTDIAAFQGLGRVDGTEIKPWYNEGAVVKYMQVYLNFPIRQVSEAQQEAILATEEFAQMEIYPLEGSMRMIDGVLVVKFGEAQE
ncbi:MAG: glucosyltransferase domain-containing protein [bacterium]|nr:glucosyltransferase domain-containing protein [bacterium]